MATNAVLHHNTPVLTASGLFHDITIYPDHLIIRRTDLLSRFFGHEEVIAFNDIKSVHAYKALFLIDNWSQLVIMCKDGRSRALSYGIRQHTIAQEVKDTIEDLLSRYQVAPYVKTIEGL